MNKEMIKETFYIVLYFISTSFFIRNYIASVL